MRDQTRNVQTKKYQQVAVIGAGPAGLTAVKSLKEAGLEVVAFESQSDLAGLWRFDEALPGGGGLAYRSLVTNTSRRMSAFSDFPFPEYGPDYPSREEVVAYINDYADAFDLRQHIEFNSTVEAVHQLKDHRWCIRIRKADTGLEERIFDAVVVASGFYQEPFFPEFPGLEAFEGKVLHSAVYVGPEGLTNKNVVVVGCSSSGADIAAEVSTVAASTAASSRSGVWFIPKLIRGKPVDLYRTRVFSRLPRKFQRRMLEKRLRASYRELGFTEADIEEKLHLPDIHGVRVRFSPATEILHQIRAGTVALKPDIDHLEGHAIVFKDGSRSEADVVIFCTGYQLKFPFLSEDTLKIQDKYTLGLYHQVFHPELDGLAFIAMSFAGGSAFSLMEIQSRWTALVFAGLLPLAGPEQRQAWINDYFEKHARQGTHPMELQLPDYMAEVGGMMGIRPRIWRHPRLWGRLLFGPMLPAHYRLDGPGKTSEAVLEILK